MKQRKFVFILVSLFILAFLWVVFNIFHSYTVSTINETTIQQIIPIVGNFDVKTIEKVKERQRVEPLFDSGSSPNISVTPQPEEEETGSESASVTPSVSPQEQQ